MEKISIFVENMFLGLPDTQPVRDARAQLLEGMTDRYEALLAQGKDPDAAFGAAVAEFGSMEEVYRELGASSVPAQTPNEAPPFRDEATLREYQEFRKQFPIAISVGVVLCILAAALPPLQSNVQDFPEEVALLNMFVLIAIAVGLFVYYGLKNRRFNRELFDREREETSGQEGHDPLWGAVMLVATCVYLLLGFTKGLWHPGWLIFPMGVAVCKLARVIWPDSQK